MTRMPWKDSDTDNDSDAGYDSNDIVTRMPIMTRMPTHDSDMIHFYESNVIVFIIILLQGCNDKYKYTAEHVPGEPPRPHPPRTFIIYIVLKSYIIIVYNYAAAGVLSTGLSKAPTTPTRPAGGAARTPGAKSGAQVRRDL